MSDTWFGKSRRRGPDDGPLARWARLRREGREDEVNRPVFEMIERPDGSLVLSRNGMEEPALEAERHFYELWKSAEAEIALLTERLRKLEGDE